MSSLVLKETEMKLRQRNKERSFPFDEERTKQKGVMANSTYRSNMKRMILCSKLTRILQIKSSFGSGGLEYSLKCGILEHWVYTNIRILIDAEVFWADCFLTLPNYSGCYSISHISSQPWRVIIDRKLRYSHTLETLQYSEREFLRSHSIRILKDHVNRYAGGWKIPTGVPIPERMEQDSDAGIRYEGRCEVLKYTLKYRSVVLPLYPLDDKSEQENQNMIDLWCVPSLLLLLLYFFFFYLDFYDIFDHILLVA